MKTKIFAGKSNNRLENGNKKKPHEIRKIAVIWIISAVKIPYMKKKQTYLLGICNRVLTVASVATFV